MRQTDRQHKSPLHETLDRVTYLNGALSAWIAVARAKHGGEAALIGANHIDDAQVVFAGDTVRAACRSRQSGIFQDTRCAANASALAVESGVSRALCAGRIRRCVIDVNKTCDH